MSVNTVERARFGGLPDGREVYVYTLTNRNGMQARIMNYGATLISLTAPDRNGVYRDVLLGFDTLEGYLTGQPYMGAVIGRVANRIAGGHFTLAGDHFVLAVNNGPNHLHGGMSGFDKALWRSRKVQRVKGVAVQFSYLSPDGEEGYPGDMDVRVVYTLTDANCLHISYSAEANRPTPVNLTNHAYFNLAGSGDILGHDITFSSDSYTPSDSTLIPTGEVCSVADSPMDFRTAMKIGERIHDVPGGYDHNFLVRGYGSGIKLAARVYHAASGRVMEMRTTEPGFQFYTGNFLDGSHTGKQGQVYHKHSGFCLEAQHFPDSVHHPHFPNTILTPGRVYRQRTVYCFSVH